MAAKKSAIRSAAWNEPCTFAIPGVCNYSKDTTVLCHLPDDSGTGKMGGKSDDWCAAFGCSSCHDVIDMRVHGKISREDREFYMRRAMIRTWRRLIELGIIEVKK